MSDDKDISRILAPPHRRAEIVFALAAFAVAIFLASQIGSQINWDTSRGMYNQPGFWPVMAICGMLIFGSAELFGAMRRYRASPDEDVGRELQHWAKSVEYAVWFMAYVLIVPYAGYLPATLAFTLALTLRLGYRSRKLILAALATGFATVIFFKSFLAAKIPGGAVYEYLPAGIRNFMILNF